MNRGVTYPNACARLAMRDPMSHFTLFASIVPLRYALGS